MWIIYLVNRHPLGGFTLGSKTMEESKMEGILLVESTILNPRIMVWVLGMTI